MDGVFKKESYSDKWNTFITVLRQFPRLVKLYVTWGSGSDYSWKSFFENDENKQNVRSFVEYLQMICRFT